MNLHQGTVKPLLVMEAIDICSICFQQCIVIRSNQFIFHLSKLDLKYTESLHLEMKQCQPHDNVET